MINNDDYNYDSTVIYPDAGLAIQWMRRGIGLL
jgi:hypothetical protein